MSRVPLLVWGASGHACVVADAAQESGGYELVGYIDNVNSVPRPFAQSQVLGGLDQLQDLRNRGIGHLIFGFGDCESKLRLESMVLESGWQFATIVHPKAVVSAGASLGAGSFVAAGAVINTGATICRHTIVNTCASIDHDCVVGEACHLSPGARLAGHVTLGRAVWLGMGAMVIPKVQIGDGAIIGAGAVVIRDIPANVIAHGVPARVSRHRTSK